MTANKAMMVLMLSLAGGAAMAAPGSSFVDFSNGAQGWEGMQPADGIGGSGIDTGMGNGAPALRTVMENFGVSFSNSSNQSYLGDYGKLGSVTIGIDVLASSIRFFNQEVSRQMVVELRDYGNTPQGMPYTSVWFDLGTIDYTKGWQHLSVTIGDTTSSVLPTGWGGYGSSDDAAGPGLPSGRTFADVLSSVDELVFTTFVPGYMYGFTDYDVAVDNISVSAVPEPSTYAMMLGGLGMIGWMKRRKARAASAV
ncbi:MAG TPA: PEPxxWA-CTERM sorting domain-containing protein [Duganella sp.]|jgi:hypothetical protein